MAAILLAGGNGYIGSHVAVDLARSGHRVTIYDSLATSRAEVHPCIEELVQAPVPFVRGDIRDRAALDALFAAHRFDAVVLLAGLKSVAESVAEPLLYYDTNVVGAIRLFQAMQSAGCRTLIFSSSATVYGASDTTPPFDETTPVLPVSPYGQSKLMIERIAADIQAADPDRWRLISLRYFNPVGAHPTGRIGEDPPARPNNLFPLIAAVAAGQEPAIEVFGNDYPTRDGTGLRDYLHVMDLAEGHRAALNYALAQRRGLAETVNLGTGRGHTVLECLAAFERASGRAIARNIAPRRAGDTAASVAGVDKAARLFGWRSRRELDEMCRDHWNWQNRHQ